MPKDVSIIIPAYNEENNIEAAVKSVIKAVEGLVDDYEVIVVNDGSRDATGEKIENLAAANPNIKVLHNERNMGYGVTLRRGIKSATKTYVGGFPGDNDISSSSLRQVMKELGTVDIVATYSINIESRPMYRRIISRSFVMLLNLLFGMKLKYYNGLFIFKRSIIQSIPIKSKGFDVIAECFVRTIKSGCDYKEIGFQHIQRKTGKSKALKLKSIFQALRTIGILIKDIYFKSSAKNQKQHCYQ